MAAASISNLRDTVYAENSSPRLLTAAGICLALVPPMMLFGIAIADILLSLCGILFLIHCAHRKHWAWLHDRWFQLAVLLWLYLCAQLLRLEHVGDALTNMSCWIRYPLFVCAARYWLLRDLRVQTWLWRSLAATVAFLTIDILLQFHLHHDLLGRPEIITYYGIRLTGPFKDPRAGIVLAWMLWPVLCVLPFLSYRKQFLRLAISAAAWVLALAAVALTGERAALLLSLAGVVAAALLLPLPKRWGAGALASAFFVLLTVALSYPALVERQYHSTVETARNLSGSIYGQLWKAGWDMGMDHVWFGVGPKQFRHHAQAYMPVANTPPGEVPAAYLHPHNIYLQWLAEFGVVGLGLFLGLLWLAGKDVAALWRNHTPPPHLVIGLVIALSLKLAPLTMPSFLPTWSALPFWLMLGWLWAQSPVTRAEPSVD